jgi:AcrR family transcriptional regulator
VSVARDVFAEQGLEAPLEAIAARAGVGIATLYRRFPAREKLVAAALTEKVAEYAGAAQQALAVTDPWAGFAGFVQRICELQAGDRGLSDLLSMTLSADEHVEQLRRMANDSLITVIDRAKAEGTLRADFVGEDLVLLLIATAAVMHVTGEDAPDTWRRFVALALDGFRSQDSPPLPQPPSTAQMTRAMVRLARERGCGGRALPAADRMTITRATTTGLMRPVVAAWRVCCLDCVETAVLVLVNGGPVDAVHGRLRPPRDRRRNAHARIGRIRDSPCACRRGQVLA